jgi:hypothetical protein
VKVSLVTRMSIQKLEKLLERSKDQIILMTHTKNSNYWYFFLQIDCLGFIAPASLVSAVAIVSRARCHRQSHLWDKPCGDSLDCLFARARPSHPRDLQHHHRDLGFRNSHVSLLALESIRYPRNAYIPDVSQVLRSDELPKSRTETLSRALACVSSSVVINPPLTLLRSHSQ